MTTHLKKWLGVFLSFGISTYIAYIAAIPLIYIGMIYDAELIQEGNVLEAKILEIILYTIPLLLVGVYIFLQLNRDILKMAAEELTTEGEPILLDPNKKYSDEINQKIVDAFNEAKEKLGVKTNVKLIRMKNDPLINAFAISNLKREAAIVVYDGIATQADKDMLQGVIGHELGHIKNKDSLIMSILYANEFVIPRLEYYSMKLMNLLNNIFGHIPWVSFVIFSIVLGYKMMLYMFLLPGKLIIKIINSFIFKQQEYLADEAGLKASSKESMIKVFKFLKQMENEGQNPTKITQMVEFLTGTHPPVEKRIAHIQKL